MAPRLRLPRRRPPVAGGWRAAPPAGGDAETVHIGGSMPKAMKPVGMRGFPCLLKSFLLQNEDARNENNKEIKILQLQK